MATWFTQTQWFPALASIAGQIFSLPCTSASVERMVSRLRCIQTPQKNRKLQRSVLLVALVRERELCRHGREASPFLRFQRSSLLRTTRRLLEEPQRLTQVDESSAEGAHSQIFTPIWPGAAALADWQSRSVGDQEPSPPRAPVGHVDERQDASEEAQDEYPPLPQDGEVTQDAWPGYMAALQAPDDGVPDPACLRAPRPGGDPDLGLHQFYPVGIPPMMSWETHISEYLTVLDP